jgi:hypothetical protein
MTTEELAELFLAHLYGLAEAAPHPNFLFTVNDFAPMFGISDGQELQKAINLLGDKGLVISAAMDMMGGISAAITMEGSIFVEEGGETGIIGRFRKDPAAFMANRLSEALPSRPEAPSSETRPSSPAGPLPGPPGTAPASAVLSAIEAIIADMADILERDAGVGDSERTDAIADLAALKIQLSRSATNARVVEALIDGLCRVAPIAPLAAALRSIVAGYDR